MFINLACEVKSFLKAVPKSAQLVVLISATIPRSTAKIKKAKGDE